MICADRPSGSAGVANIAHCSAAVRSKSITPGMEVPGRDAETYDVIAWSGDGTHRPFMRYVGARHA